MKNKSLTVKELINQLENLGEEVENVPVFYMGDDGLISRVFINYIELENGEEDYHWIMLE